MMTIKEQFTSIFPKRAKSDPFNKKKKNKTSLNALNSPEIILTGHWESGEIYYGQLKIKSIFLEAHKILVLS